MRVFRKAMSRKELQLTRGAPPESQFTAPATDLHNHFLAGRTISFPTASRAMRVALAAALALALVTPITARAQTGAPRPRVHVIATGGTISNLGGGDDNRRTGTELVGGIPDLAQIADVTVEQFSNVASGAITQDMWRRLAHRIRELASSNTPPAGVVITHGTDTMEETAYFLDLTVGGCAPVFITGAMRQANATGADGPANLRNAIRAAAAPVSRGRGTMVLMNDEIFSARAVTKSNTSRMNAFTGVDVGPMGVADPDTVVYYQRAADGPCQPSMFNTDAMGDFPRVDVVYAYIGADSVLVDALVTAGARGLVLAGVGRGGSTPALGRALRRATEHGVFIAVSNRTGSGRTGGGGPPDDAGPQPGRGVQFGASNLNPQKARILLMLALAAKFDANGIAELFRSQ